MAERSFPFNSIAGDRKYKSEQFREYFALFIGNGIFYRNANVLKVKENEGMMVTLQAGAAWVAGGGYINEGQKHFTLEMADGVLPRIDRVVIRCDYVLRDIYATVKKGSYSAQPSPPQIQRDADAYELAVADIYVGRGAISITQSSITDLRLNSELCGIVTGLIEQADTTEIFNQIETYFEEFKKEYAENFSAWTKEYIDNLQEWTEERQAEVNAWIAQTEAGISEWQQETQDSLEAWIRNTQESMTEWTTNKESDLAAWIEETQSSFAAWITQSENSYEAWRAQNEEDFAAWQEEQKTYFGSWMNANKQAYEEWLAGLKEVLDENIAGHLQNEIEELQDEAFYLKYGLTNKTVEFLEDGSVRTTEEDAVAETEFGFDSEGNETATTTVTPTEGQYKYVMVAKFVGEESVQTTTQKLEKM